jgi:hypothetical protein
MQFKTANALIIVFLLAAGCGGNGEPLTEESLYREYKESFFEAVRDNTVMVMEDILIDYDTMEVTSESYFMRKMPARDSVQEYELLRKGDKLIARQFLDNTTRFAIYDKKMQFKAMGYLPTFMLARVFYPQSQYQKAAYYDKLGELLKKYQEEICTKYKITEDSLAKFVAWKETKIKNETMDE